MPSFWGQPIFSVRSSNVRTTSEKARFDQPPILAQTKRLASEQSDGLLQTREGQYVLDLGLSCGGGAADRVSHQGKVNEA